MNVYAYDLEIEHGMNIAAAASEPGVLKTLTHFVYSALANSKRISKGKYSHNYHYDSKGVVVERIREELPDLAARLSTVQIGAYLTNWKLNPMMGPQKVCLLFPYSEKMDRSRATLVEKHIIFIRQAADRIHRNQTGRMFSKSRRSRVRTII